MDWFPVLFRDDPAGQLIESLRESFPLSADTHDHAVVTQAIRSLAQLQNILLGTNQFTSTLSINYCHYPQPHPELAFPVTAGNELLLHLDSE